MPLGLPVAPGLQSASNTAAFLFIYAEAELQDFLSGYSLIAEPQTIQISDFQRATQDQFQDQI